MSGRRYAQLRVPRPMSFDRAPQVVAYLADLVDAELNHGMPVQRRMGRLVALLGRRGTPRTLVAGTLRAHPARHEKPELETLTAVVARHWDVLAGRSARLPASRPDLRGLLVERTHVDMAFVFGDGRWPLLVAKQLAAGVPDDGLRREREALERVRPAGIGPRHLGVFDGVWVQEALPGLPLRLRAIDRDNAPHLTWSPEFDDLDQALRRLAGHTSRTASLSAYDAQMLKLATTFPLPEDVQATVDRARRHVAASGRTVLQHADLLAQNWIVEDGRFSGLVDWETCLFDGMAGSDLLEASVSAFEHGIALRDWSSPLLVDLFEEAWSSADYFARTRTALVGVVEAAGLRSEDAEPLLVAYFAHRLGRHLANPAEGVVGEEGLARLLTVVCRGIG